MKFKLLFILLVLLSNQAFSQTTTTNDFGISCKVIQEGDGRPVQDSVILSTLVSVVVLTDGQEVMRKDHSGRVGSNPLLFSRAQIDPVFSLLMDKKIGDSLCVEIPYNEKTKTFLPPNSTATSVGYLYIKLVSMETFVEREAKERKEIEERIAKEDEQIRKYLEDNGLLEKAQKTASGMYIVRDAIHFDGIFPESGQKVRVHYTGTLLNSTEVFDSSIGKQPYEFPLGQGQVIKGWDEGIAKLCEGEKAILILPSHLGYGARGAGAKIPASSILKFDVELVGIK